jgi:hypothetical protein
MVTTQSTALVVTAVLAWVGLAGCSALAPSACPTGLNQAVRAELFFGRDIPGGGQVGEEEWRRFVDEEITPRFPDGFSVEDASGQWKGASGIVREPSKRLTIVLTGRAADQSKLAALRDAYRRRFRQDSVLLVQESVCAGF